MKARFLALAALVLGLASCQTEPESLGVNVGGEQDVTVCVSLPEVTRANSAEGAFVNVVNSDDYTIRYILQVFYGETAAPQDVKYSDDTSVNFDVRLVPGRNYNFVVWADVVKEAERTDLHYNTANLKEITFKGDWNAMDETRDAFTVVEPIVNYNGSKSINLTLTRPFAKLRVQTTDLVELANLGLAPYKTVVTYTTAHYRSFNALNGVPTDKTYASKAHELINLESYGYEANTLFVDYFYATESPETVKFEMKVYDKDEVEPLKTNNFSTDIPVQRNYLTTISGNILTDGNNITVTVENDGAFEGNENWPDTTAEQLAYAAMFGGEVTLAENVELTQPLAVRAGAHFVLNLNGKTLKNNVNNEATDVIIVEQGGKLTINGEGTVEAVSGNDGYAVISSGEVVINGGTFKAGVDENGEANAVVYARGNGKVYVNGGNFPNEANSTFVLNKRDADRATTVIEVRGGSFRNFNPANNAAENPGTNFVAEGYISVSNDDFYNVIPGTYATTQDDILSALTNTDVDAMLMGANVDVTSYDTVMVENNISVYAEGKTITAGAHNMGSNASLVPSFAVMSEYNVTLDKANIVGGGVFACYGANLEINSGSLTYKEGASGRQCYYAASNTDKQAIITIKDVDVNMSNAKGNSYVCAHGNAIVYIEGGNFYGKGERASNAPIKVVSQWGYTAKVIISGGTFDFDPSSNYIGSNSKVYAPQATIATGYKVVNNNNGTWSVVAE